MTSPKCYSAAFTDDVHLGVEEVQRRFPDAPLFAAGFSLGSMILTKYLAEADSGKWPGQGRVAYPHSYVQMYLSQQRVG